MKKSENKIATVIDEKRVKLHLFEPSHRKIWTVVGKGKEHWLDPNLEYCSCESFYFNNVSGKNGCYHLESQKIAEKEKKVEMIKFSDEEFSDFVSGLIADI